MRQTRGPYAGSRNSGERRPRHVEQSSPNRQRQPHTKAPDRDPAQTASIFKTRSFQFLVNAVGAENIALGLESSMTRVAELMKGERFTPETAFHMETTLGLPHGFFDQSHPVLTPETIARLKSPLDFVQSDEEPEAESQAPEPAAALNVGQQSFLEESLPEEAEMPKKAPIGSSPTARNGASEMAKQPRHRAARSESPAKSKTSEKASQQQPLALNDRAAVENIRRANLHVLTTRNGSKVKLGVVMAMSGSNMAHRLHGKKRLDDVEAGRFTERLGLPVGWLDTPRSESEIPESVSLLLTPGLRGRAAAQQQEPLSTATNDGGSEKRPNATGRKRSARRVNLGDAQELTVPANVPNEEPMAVGLQDPVTDSPGEPAGRSVDESEEVFPGPSPTTIEALPAPMAQRDLASPPVASVTSLDNLDGIAPIAEALIKTLAGKARTGRLDELKALELLQQAIRL
ncbi:hypothetical protein AWB78_03996 [Caballeronia calidae]|uniref:Uncharacterized protein n=1 Tax=Caballeronia calidae TaxID=1777139 RepID=A0A158CIT6_9BURK|nr:hypothetical protein [Caballeronia calidae]SAK82192.1 hypothetical protein AWB78_03996 [Caballeronia calidae]